MIELTPHLADRLAEKKRRWAEDKGKDLPPPETLLCRVCKRPSEWRSRVAENRVPPRGMVPKPLAGKPMVVNVLRNFTSQMRKIGVHRGVQSYVHWACVGDQGFNIQETALWGEKVLL